MLWRDRGAVFALTVPVLILVVVGSLSYGRVERTPDGFAAAHHLVLDDETRGFVTFHLARTRLHRQVGALVGFLAGLGLQRLIPGGLPIALVSMLGGAVVGTGIAELARWFPTVRRPRRVASLEPRSRANYLSAESRWLERLMVALLTAVGAVALWQNRAQRVAVVVMTAAGVLVLVTNRAVGRRIAERAVVDSTHPNLAAADRAVRVASVDTLATLVASLALCIVTWLVIGSVPAQYDVVVSGTHVLALPDRADHLSMTPGDASVAVSWQVHGAAASTVVSLPTVLHGNQAPLGFGPRHPTRSLIAGAIALLTGSWAFGEWLRVSRIAFLRTTNRAGRRTAVAA